MANSTTRLTSKSSLHQAVQHLVEARDKVRRKLQGLVGSCDVTAVLALPCLTQAESDDVRKHIKILRSHPDVELLPGLDTASYHQWMEGLREEKASKVWRSGSQGGDHPDAVYKMAASSFLTLGGCGGPGESPHSPDPAQSWLLTPTQVEVRDSTAKLLHIRGPPGSGKTTLLVHRARQWLAEGKAVILGIGKKFYDVKLAQLDEAVRKGQTEEAIGNLRVCHTYQDMVRETREFRGRGKPVEICQVVDILHNDTESFQKSLSSVRAKEPLCVWTTSWRTLSDINPDLSKEATDLGWESVKLPDCIRCTKNTVELLNLLRKDVFHPIPSCSLPRDPDIPAWRVVDHCLHPDHVTTVSRCDGCKTEMSQVLPSPEKGLVWSNWIALHTGNKYKHFNLETLREAMQYCGVPTFYESMAYVRQDSTSSSSAPAPDAPVQGFATFRERVLRGVDTDGQPTVHLVETGDFTGLEREGVILVHWDERDNDPGQQSQADRDARLKDHRRQWMKAVPVSKGQVILLLLTPSPARSLLDLPEPVMA